MHTAADFVAYCLGFLPALSLVVIALAVFGAIVLMVPSLRAYMTAADVTEEETEQERTERNLASYPFDQYV